MMAKRALIAMSGGVDSSAAAAMMIDKGYECIGVNMKLYTPQITDESGCKSCCSADDAIDARNVCRKLGMDFSVCNFSEDFSRQVIDRFIGAYEAGFTPNPCIDCNKYMKYGMLYQKAKELHCEHIVTGHYARIEYDDMKQRWLLKKAKNVAKDQSYVLYFLTQEQLAHIIFPLGEFESKDQVREFAGSFQFENAKKQDSQDICFVPDGDYAGFIQNRTGKDYPKGNFVDTEGNVLGQHKGIIRYTIGQRRGLGLALPQSMYVKRKDMNKNEVILSTNEELFSTRLIAEHFNWISMEQPNEPIRAKAKTRYQAKDADATVRVLEGCRVEVLFDEPQRALTMGQSVVLYDEDTVIGGGIITEV